MCMCFNCYGLGAKKFLAINANVSTVYRARLCVFVCACVPKGQQTQFDNYDFILVLFRVSLCSPHFAICRTLCPVRVELSYAKLSLCIHEKSSSGIHSACQCCLFLRSITIEYTIHQAHNVLQFNSLAHSIWKLKSIFLNVVGSNPKNTHTHAHALNDHLSLSLGLSFSLKSEKEKR